MWHASTGYSSEFIIPMHRALDFDDLMDFISQVGIMLSRKLIGLIQLLVAVECGNSKQRFCSGLRKYVIRHSSTLLLDERQARRTFSVLGI
jgi:hypothetical protein